VREDELERIGSRTAGEWRQPPLPVLTKDSSTLEKRTGDAVERTEGDGVREAEHAGEFPGEEAHAAREARRAFAQGRR
jgi:hypothetical protein